VVGITPAKRPKNRSLLVRLPNSGEGITLNNLGLLASDLGRPEEVARYYEQALAIVEDIGAVDLARTVRENLEGVRVPPPPAEPSDAAPQPQETALAAEPPPPVCRCGSAQTAALAALRPLRCAPLPGELDARSGDPPALTSSIAHNQDFKAVAYEMREAYRVAAARGSWRDRGHAPTLDGACPRVEGAGWTLPLLRYRTGAHGQISAQRYPFGCSCETAR